MKNGTSSGNRRNSTASASGNKNNSADLVKKRNNTTVRLNERAFVAARLRKVAKDDFNVKYPSDYDFEAAKGSQRAQELQKLETPNSEFSKFSSADIEALSLEEVTKIVGARFEVVKEWKTDGKNSEIAAGDKEIFGVDLIFGKGETRSIDDLVVSRGVKNNKNEHKTINKKNDVKTTIDDFPEITNPINGRFRFDSSRRLYNPAETRDANSLVSDFYKIDDILKGEKSNQNKLQAIEKILGRKEPGNNILQSWFNKFKKGTTSSYAVFCLKQQFAFARVQIEEYNQVLEGITSEEAMGDMSNKNRDYTKVILTNFVRNAAVLEKRWKESVELFHAVAKPVMEDVGAVEEFQTNKLYKELVFAEKYPAVRKFESRILSSEEFAELLNGQKLSGQQAKLLIQIEEILINPQARFKIRGILDTGMGKTFLAEKIAKYSELLANRESENSTKVRLFEVVNINLANQDYLKELEKQGDLHGKLVIIDEDFFIAEEAKDLRKLVDKGAKIIRFGASENHIKLLEDLNRIEEKNEDSKKITANDFRIEFLKKSLAENTAALGHFDSLRKSYKKHGESQSQLFERFDSDSFQTAMTALKKQGLVAISDADFDEKMNLIGSSNFKGSANRTDKIHKHKENKAPQEIRNLLQAVEDHKSVALVRILQEIKSLENDTETPFKEIKEIYQSLKKLQVFEEKAAEKLEKIFGNEDSKFYKNFELNRQDFLPVFKFAVSKALVEMEIDVTTIGAKPKSYLNTDQKLDENFKYLTSLQKNFKSQIDVLEKENSKLEEANKVFIAKRDLRKEDMEAVKKRRELAKTRLESSEVKTVAAMLEWDQAVIENNDQTSLKSQNIFPGISLQDDDSTRKKLLNILQESGTEIVVANIVENGKHRCLVAKKGKNEVVNCEIESPEFDELAQGVSKAITIYAGERLEFVIGGDYKKLSVLQEGDQQNIYLPNEDEHYDIDRFKQYFGRDRGNGEDIKRTVISTENITPQELAKQCYRNSQEKDLSDKIESLWNKVEKYFDEENDVAMEQMTALQDELKKKNIAELAEMALEQSKFESFVPSADELKNNANSKKYYRDVKALIFFSLIEKLDEDKDIDVAQVFKNAAIKVDFEASEFELPKKLEYFFQNNQTENPKFDVLDNIEELSQILHLRQKPERDLSSLDSLKLESEAVLAKLNKVAERKNSQENLQNIENKPDSLGWVDKIHDYLKVVLKYPQVREAVKELSFESNDQNQMQSFSFKNGDETKEYRFKFNDENKAFSLVQMSDDNSENPLDADALMQISNDILRAINSRYKDTGKRVSEKGEVEDITEENTAEVSDQESDRTASKEAMEEFTKESAHQLHIIKQEAHKVGQEFIAGVFAAVSDRHKNRREEAVAKVITEEASKVVQKATEGGIAAVLDRHKSRIEETPIQAEAFVSEEAQQKFIDEAPSRISQELQVIKELRKSSVQQEQLQETKETLNDFLEKRITEIQKNDAHNYTDVYEQKDKKLLNTNKVVRALGKIAQAKESLGKTGKAEHEDYSVFLGKIFSGDLNDSLPKNLQITAGDQSVLASFFLNDEDRKAVFGANLDRPRFNPNKLTSERAQAITNGIMNIEIGHTSDAADKFLFESGFGTKDNRITTKFELREVPSSSPEKGPRGFEAKMIITNYKGGPALAA